MSALGIILIVVGFVILLGPIMLLTAKLNHFDPFILEKGDEAIKADERSFLLVGILRPLLYPLWVEAKIVRYVSSLFKK